MSERNSITLLAELAFAEPVAETELLALAAVVGATRQEPGCQEYAAHVHAEDPKRVLFYERWQDQAALDAHNASAHLATFRSAVGPRLAAPSQLSFWKRLD
ncbi:MAG: antibiotic biosynthesis monooxygenase [Proteobacteria bacterium]|nr:antibiotic biosynthesis monooxygenase [Pseudomonadota bacterium]